MVRWGIATRFCLGDTVFVDYIREVYHVLGIAPRILLSCSFIFPLLSGLKNLIDLFIIMHVQALSIFYTSHLTKSDWWFHPVNIDKNYTIRIFAAHVLTPTCLSIVMYIITSSYVINNNHTSENNDDCCVQEILLKYRNISIVFWVSLIIQMIRCLGTLPLQTRLLQTRPMTLGLT